MSPFPTDEMSPELGPSPPLLFLMLEKAMCDLVIYLRNGFGDKSRDHTDMQSLNFIASSQSDSHHFVWTKQTRPQSKWPLLTTVCLDLSVCLSSAS